MYVCMCVFIYVCVMCIYIYIYVYIFAYIYFRESCSKSQYITERHNLISQTFLYRNTHIQPLDGFLLLSTADSL